MILTISAEQSWMLLFSMIERDVVKVNQNQDTAFFPLIMLLLIQLLNSLRLSSSDIFTLPPKLKV